MNGKITVDMQEIKCKFWDELVEKYTGNEKMSDEELTGLLLEQAIFVLRIEEYYNNNIAKLSK